MIDPTHYREMLMARVTAVAAGRKELETKLTTLRESITNLGTPTLTRLLSLLNTIKTILGVNE